MNDKEFLQWVWDRLNYQHGDNANFDYMHKLKAIIEEYDPEKVTPNIIKTDFNAESLAIESIQKDQMVKV